MVTDGHPIVTEEVMAQQMMLGGLPAKREFAETGALYVAIAARAIIDAFKVGCKVMACGNGGSASEAQHLVAELVGRFQSNRRALPAVALTADTSILTAVANDRSFVEVFSRQVEALARSGDVLVAYSTSGNSVNVVAAVHAAKKVHAVTIGMTGRQGGVLADICDIWIAAPTDITATIQECHTMATHALCAIVDEYFDREAPA